MGSSWKFYYRRNSGQESSRLILEVIGALDTDSGSGPGRLYHKRSYDSCRTYAGRTTSIERRYVFTKHVAPTTVVNMSEIYDLQNCVLPSSYLSALRLCIIHDKALYKYQVLLFLLSSDYDRSSDRMIIIAGHFADCYRLKSVLSF